MIKSTITSDHVEIVCSPNVLLTEYSYAIEQGLNWFFGCGVNAVRVERSKNPTREQVVNIFATVKPKKLIFSQVSSMGALARMDYWPKEIQIENLWTVEGDRTDVRDGQHRLIRANKEGSIIQTYGLVPETKLGDLTYGLSDLFTGFFWLGATWCRYQGSMAVSQIMTNKGFDQKELHDYLADPDPGYSIGQPVSTLS